MKIVLSTSNPSKLHQIKDIFAGSNIELLGLREAGIEGDAVEDGKTLEENALKKAYFAQEHGSGWVLADDTGLFIDALDGVPGMHAARWAGDVSTEEIMNFTLNKIKDVPEGKRGAEFRTIAVTLSPEGNEKVFVGSVRGRLLTAPRVPCQPKMPYSSIFLPEGHDRVWSEMPVDEENAISHRGKAFRQAMYYLKSI